MSYSDMTIYVAISMLEGLYLEDNQDNGLVYQMIDELVALSNTLEVNFPYHGTQNLAINLVQDSKRQLLHGWSKPVVLDRCEILEFSCQIPFSTEYEIHDETPFTVESVNKALIPTVFTKRICDILITTHLARVGSILWKDSIVIQDGKIQTHLKLPNMSCWSVYKALEIAAKIKWPSIKVIPFTKVWNWANKNKGFIDGFGGGAIGRAINAFSRILSLSEDESDLAVQLLWSMLGIEALYGKGKSSVMEQIRDKTHVILGSPSEFKKKINTMYDFRSRFLHGDLDFPSLSFIYDGMDEYERYTSEQEEAVGIATAILIATIQELILRDWQTLEFSYIVRE